jgi:1-acyl-sn-glycerol-3-phosphate acyltransferase
MAALRSILFALFFYTGSVFIVAGAAAMAAVGGRPFMAAVRLWPLWHRWCNRVLLGIRSRVEGNVPSGSLLFAGKHQSMYETVELLLILDLPAVILKQELASIPGWGWAAKRYGNIPVDREGGATALRRMMKAAKEAISAGRAILIFPEGTRVVPGERPPLQAGFAGLYRAIGLPVVPIALDSGLLWPRRSFVKRPGVVTFRFGEPIPPGLPRAEIEARVHASINALES